MSVRIFEDTEEALGREVRRITFHNTRTLDKTILKEVYDVFSGEIIEMPIEPNFYDSSADAGQVQYPHFFIKLLKSREDRFTGRIIPQYGKWCSTPVINTPSAFQIILSGSDGLIPSVGNDFETSAFQISKIQSGYLLRLLSGNNKGTYIIDSITISNTGNHIITVSNTLKQNLPEILFNATTRVVYFQESVDLFTVKIGDIFTDFLSNNFNITAVDASNGTITIDGIINPDLGSNSTISRSGNVFTNTDLSLIKFIIMDPSKPIEKPTVFGNQNQSSVTKGSSPEVPIDAFYLIRIDSKTKQNHTAILNRVWEEFNPPRTGLPVIKRTSLSAEQLLTADIPTGGSNQLEVEDTTNFSVGDTVFIIDDLNPTKKIDGEGFERPFESKVVGKPSSTQLELEDTIPDTFKVSNCTKVISNAEFRIFMFNFVDHVTRDVDGSQYWVHEFTFWIQIWIDRLETSKEVTTITDIATPIEDLEGNIIFDDF